MLHITERSITAKEKEKMQHLRPCFLFRERRRRAEQEIEEGIVEVFDLEVLRAWDLNGCQPPCCPHIYLFEVGEGLYLYAESWTAFNFPEGEFPKRRMQIVRTPRSKRILNCAIGDAVIEARDSPFDGVNDYFSFPNDVECEVMRAREMSEEVRTLLNPDYGPYGWT